MNHQEIFDRVVDHLARQKAPAIDDQGNCVLRGEQGRKCAVGALIPDNAYHPNMEFDSALCYASSGGAADTTHGWIRRNMGAMRDTASADFRLLQRLQTAHDEAAELPEYHVGGAWSEKLDACAEKYGLIFDRIEFLKRFDDPSYCYPSP